MVTWRERGEKTNEEELTPRARSLSGPFDGRLAIQGEALFYSAAQINES
jgi:hypothetical protein